MWAAEPSRVTPRSIADYFFCEEMHMFDSKSIPLCVVDIYYNFLYDVLAKPVLFTMDNTTTTRKDYEPVIQYLNDCELSVADLINVLLTDKKYKKHSLMNNLLVNGSEMIIMSLLGHASCKHLQFAMLEDFAKSKPNLDDLRALARELVKDNIANEGLSLQ